MTKTKHSFGNEDWSRIVNIYDHAITLGADRRAAYLDQTCSKVGPLRGLLSRRLGAEKSNERRPVE